MVKTTNNVKVSILVPIYNVEKFLPECLDGLIRQTLGEIEIVCINDGSTDGSLDIIKKYANLDKRILVIDKKNTGYGDSVNTGIQKAKGEYIGIVEPDDFVDKNAFKKMFDIAKKNDAEVVKANFYNYSTLKHADISKSEMFLKSEIGRVVRPFKDRHIFYQQPSVWSAIYKKSFLLKNKIDFLPSPGASYQDAGFTFKVWVMAERVVFLDEAFLHYRQDNPNSSVKSSGKIYAVKDEYDEVERYLRERNLMSEYGGTLAVVRLGGYLWNMRRLEKKTALEFANEVEKDYGRYKKAGYLNPDKLDDENAKFIANSIIVKNPRKYIRIRPLYEAWDRFKIFGLGVYRKIRRR